MTVNRVIKVWLFIFAVAAWCVTSFVFAPPSFVYTSVFFLLCLTLFVTTYRLPISGWWFFIALIPIINIPSRAIAIGAHRALIFWTYTFVLGWLANKLVTKERPKLNNNIAIPLYFIIFIGISSCIATVLSFSNFYPFFTNIFKNGWVNAYGVLASQAIIHSVLSLLKFLIFPALFIASYDIWQRNSQDGNQLIHLLKKVIVIWAIALIPVFIIAIYQNLFNPQFCLLNEPAWQEARRVSGGMSDPNSLGLFLFLFLPAAASFALAEKGFKQIILVFSIITGIYVTTLTGSRSALLGIILVILISLLSTFVFAVFNKTSRKKTLLISGTAFIIILALPFFLTGITDMSHQSDNPLIRRLQKYTRGLTSSKSDRIVDRREWQWKQAVTMWKDYPFTGIGIGAFPIQVSNYNLQTMTETPSDNAWNQYLHWLSETGIAGIIFWAWFYFAFITTCVKCLKKSAVKKIPSSVFVVAVSLIVLHFLYIFGAHLQAPEIAVCSAMFSSFLLVFFCREKNSSRLKRLDVLFLIAIAIIIAVNQFNNAINTLSYSSIQQKYKLPYDFGFYQKEKWNGDFSYRWTQKFAGEKISFPKNKKIIVLKMAAINPLISEKNKKRVAVKINNKYLDTIIIDNPDWHDYQIYCFNEIPSPAELTLECDSTWTPPSEYPPRALGIAFADKIIFTNVFTRESQGLSDWYEENINGKKIKYRWTGKNAAVNLEIPKNKTFTVKLKAPHKLRFYEKPLKVTVKLNNKFLDKIILTKDNPGWIAKTFSVNENSKNKNALLTIQVNRLSTFRIKNSTRRIKVGVALTIDY